MLLLRTRVPLVACVVCALGAISACVKAQRALDAGDPGFPFGPSAVGPGLLSYTQNIKPIFDTDCLSCHSAGNAQGGYSVSTYAATVAGQRPGDAASPLVVDCAPSGSMYHYFSGDAVTKATEVFRWMVYFNAVEDP